MFPAPSWGLTHPAMSQHPNQPSARKTPPPLHQDLCLCISKDFHKRIGKTHNHSSLEGETRAGQTDRSFLLSAVGHVTRFNRTIPETSDPIANQRNKMFLQKQQNSLQMQLERKTFIFTDVGDIYTQTAGGTGALHETDARNM